ncbi:glycerol ethanol, ferric requiring protein [Vanrija albida]|uniref:Chloride channel protein n=1 Tax=Vanrija albida TaxID=181172 RepID=A0ABR3QBA8_9TREE
MAYPPTAEALDSNGGGPSSRPPPAFDAEVELQQIKRYEDFSTVDWIQDSLREGNPKSRSLPRPGSLLDRLNSLDGVLGYLWRALSRAYQEGESYVVITLVGIGIGFSAALMAIITGWLSDIKLGHCSTGWWLGRKFCCIEISEDGGCDEWHDWGSIPPFPWLVYITYAGVFCGTAAYLVRSFAPYAAGSGISEIKCILGGFIINGYLSFETLVIKALTMPLSIGSGLSVGKEGPSVHVACAVGNVVGGLFPRFRDSQLKMREILTAASAAGVAVAFGSPIGGVLFSIEEMNQAFSTRTMWRSFFCALVATFTLSSMDPFRTGKLVLFTVSYDRDWHYFEIPAYILIGVFGGCYGAFVSKYNLQVAAFRRKHLAKHGVAEAVVLAVGTGMIGYMNRFLRIDMTESMSILFRECEGGGDKDGLCQASSQWRMVYSLLLATIIRIGFIIVSYGSKVPAGIFVPSMAVGATFGRMIGILVKALQQSFPNAPWFASACAPDAPCITPGTYAFLGAGAALGGITNLTVTVVVIMFELTGALTYVLPTMIVILVTKAVSDQIGKGGIAEQMIRFNGYPFLEKEDAEAGDKAFFEPIGHIMRKDLVVIPATGIPLEQVSDLVQSSSYQGFPVVKSDEDRSIVGFMRKNELRYALDRARRTHNVSADALCTFQETNASLEHLSHRDVVFPEQGATGGNPYGSGEGANRVDFGQYLDETPLTVSPKMPLEIVLQLFRRMGPRVILVTHEGTLVGLVTVKDVLRHEASEKHRVETAETSRSRQGSWDGGWGGGPGGPERTPALEGLLEDGFTWARTHGVGAVNTALQRVRQYNGTSPRPDDAYRFEMNDEQQEQQR